MTIANLLIKTPDQILQDALDDYEGAMAEQGITANVLPGSDFYIRAQSIANAIGLAMNNNQIVADALAPWSAVDADLDQWLNVFGLDRRPAGAGLFLITFDATRPDLVATGVQLQNSSGILYAVTTGGTYNPGDTIEIISIDTGTQVNLNVGDQLQWFQTPGFASAYALCAGTLVQAVNAESDDEARTRLYDTIRNPANGGNWQFAVALAESAAPAIQKAFCYPAANGAGTVHVAVCKPPDIVSKSRQIDTLTLNKVVSAVQNGMPAYVEIATTGVVDEPVSLSLSLTMPKGAVGGGFVNDTAFPVPAPGFTSCPIIGTPGATLVIKSGIVPTVGVSQVSWIDRNNPSGWTVRSATVVAASVAGDTITWTLTLDQAFVGIATGDYIFPTMANGQGILDAVLDFVGHMGPGQMVFPTNPQNTRQPLPSLSYPDTFTGLLKTLTNLGPEVLAADFLSFPNSEPPIADDTNSPPYVYIPLQLGFYSAT